MFILLFLVVFSVNKYRICFPLFTLLAFFLKYYVTVCVFDYT